MKLLILTQKVDKNDEALGFFHAWIQELAQYCTELTVVCLEKGEYDLPPHVRVLSLGKEQKKSHRQYITRFYNFIWRERKKYDSVFVHMNKEYVLLGGLLWRFMKKRVVFWYTHPAVNWSLRLAVGLSSLVVTSHSLACGVKSSKVQVLGHGIDTDLFCKVFIERSKTQVTQLLFLGRIAPVKNVVQLVSAFAELNKTGGEYFLHIVGSALPRDKSYNEEVVERIASLGLVDRVHWWGGVKPSAAVDFYNRNDIFINLTRTGSFDKTILEAMASGCLVVICNRAFESVLGPELAAFLLFKENDSKDLAQKIFYLSNLSQEKQEDIRRQLRSIVVERYSLKQLILRLCQLF